MIVIVKPTTKQPQLQELVRSLEGMGVQVHLSQGVNTTLLGLVGDTSAIDIGKIRSLEIVEEVKRIQEPYKKANRKFHPLDTQVKVGDVTIGGGSFTVIAGPCSVESREQMTGVARSVQASGAALLRGGAFKPRTSPYSFQGLRAQGLEILLQARRETGMPIVTELMSQQDWTPAWTF